ncbi:hypothetical protein Scep_016435 [Stephania cephalantha]|uniref:Uncharacterized protein n=1 Tax=Stephania cephalantha TaxID=152367 RepID=A0AAP0NSL7_9MAGN
MARTNRSKISTATNTPPSTNSKKGKRIKVEAKPVDSPPPKKMRATSSGTRNRKEVLAVEKPVDLMGCNKTKGNEVLAMDNPVNLMGCRTEESLTAYRTNFVVRDNDDEDNEKDEGEDQPDIRLLENDSEVESAKMGGYEPSVDRDMDGNVGDVAMGGNSDDDRITWSMSDFEFLVSTPPIVDEVNEKRDHVRGSEEIVVNSPVLGDATQGHGHPDEKANEVARKVESSRKITKEFVERLDPVVQECDKALHDRMVRKNWKCTWHRTK